MSKTATRFLALACLFFVSLSTQAQENRFVKEADNAYNNEAYYTAIDLYKKAYAKESNIDEKARMIFMIGESYRQVLDLEQQIVWYDKALKANYDKPEAYKHLGEAYRQMGNFPEAILNYERYLEKMGADPEAEKVLAAMEASKKWMEKPGRYQVNNEVILNSKEYDFAPSWAARDYNTVYFTSSRQGAEGIEIDERTGENFQDILKSTRDNKGKWSEPLRLPNRINGGQNDGGSVFNSTFDVMYFTRCESEKDVNKGCDIYRVKKVGADWGQPEKLPLKPAPEKNGPVYSVGHPSLNKDETMMIFAGDIPGSLGGKDLFMVTYDKAADSWGKPVNLGAEINTKLDEMFPFLREDGTLFFASEGHPGMGGLDIFSASSTGENQWGNVTNMKPPINSVSHDFGIIFEGVEERGFFTSNREGGKGQDDLYTFTLPALEFALEGVVYDKEASTPVPQAKVKVVGNDGSAFEIETDDNGAFRFAENGDQRYINPETSYSIEVSKPDYLVARDKISTVGIKESTTFAKEYLITFTAPDVAIEFPEVRYAYNKAELLVDAEVNSKDSLNYLYDVLVENPTIIIELQAHTDSRGNDKYNQELSQRRAQSCVDYLVERGIPRDRMRAKGYGESRLRISDAQIAKMSTNEEKEAAHQKNRRTEFTVLSFDYVPKEAVEEGNN